MLGMLIRYPMWPDSQAGQCRRRKVALRAETSGLCPDGVPWLPVTLSSMGHSSPATTWLAGTIQEMSVCLFPKTPFAKTNDSSAEFVGPCL